MNLFKRSLVALAGIPFLMFLALTGSGWTDYFFAALVSAFSIYEFMRMFGIKSSFHITAAVSAGLMHLAALRYGFSQAAPFVVLLVVLLPVEALLYNYKEKRDASRIFVTFFSSVYITYFFSFFIRMKGAPSLGSRWAAAFFVSVWVIDSAAYFVGMLLGRKRGIVAVSPKKSVAGFLGGMLIPLAFSPLFSWYLGQKTSAGMLIMALLSITVQAGDLSESLIKRYAGVKDSGTLLGPHGGIFDRFDSMIFSLPLFYWIARLLVN